MRITCSTLWVLCSTQCPYILTYPFCWVTSDKYPSLVYSTLSFMIGDTSLVHNFCLPAPCCGWRAVDTPGWSQPCSMGYLLYQVSYWVHPAFMSVYIGYVHVHLIIQIKPHWFLLVSKSLLFFLDALLSHVLTSLVMFSLTHLFLTD